MTMYLSNADVRPTGYEPAEFIEPPVIPAARQPTSGPADVDGESDDVDIDDAGADEARVS